MYFHNLFFNCIKWNKIKEMKTLFPGRNVNFSALLFSVCAIFFASCDSGEPQEVKVHYESGELHKHYFVKDGKKVGEYLDYRKDGSIRSRLQFENDLQSGQTIHYTEDGKIREVQYYIDGKREFGDTLFYPDGSIEFTTDFKNNKKHGYLRKWNKNGDIFFEAKYDMDKLVEVNGENVDDGID